MPTDAELLRCYAHEGSEHAFAQLFSQHEKLVLGVAYRATGDLELARDVTQQVFTALARKAHELSGRASLAGWLYQAARFQASKSRRGRAHPAASMERLPEVAGVGAGAPSLHADTALEEALAALGEKEREALLLHYFEDRSYGEMSQALQLSEAACRKRVSRALQALGSGLRERGVAASATKLIVGAVAAQSTLPAQAAALAASASTAPAALLFTTIMAQTSTKLAVAAVALIAAPVAFLEYTHVQLGSEQAAAPSALARPSAARGREVPEASPPAPFEGRPEAVLAVWDELRAAQSRRVEAEEKLAALQRQRAQIDSEVVVSFGEVRDLAARFVRVQSQLDRLRELKKISDPEERRRKAEEIGQKMNDFGDLIAITLEARKLEAEPEKAARFYADLMGELVGLPGTEREPLVAAALPSFEQLRHAGLSSQQRPPDQDKANEETPWMTERLQLFRTMEAALIAALPPEQRPEAERRKGYTDLAGTLYFPPRTP